MGSVLIDARYHITSLVAVFVALATGIVIGGLLLGEHGFDAQQRRLIAQIEGEIAQSRSAREKALLERDRLARRLQETEKLLDEVLLWSVEDRLRGRQLAVAYAGGDLPPGGRELVALLQAAGAEVTLRALASPAGLLELVATGQPVVFLEEGAAGGQAGAVLKQLQPGAAVVVARAGEARRPGDARLEEAGIPLVQHAEEVTGRLAVFFHLLGEAAGGERQRAAAGEGGVPRDGGR